MKKETKEVLTAMGFTLVSGILWNHKGLNLTIYISEDSEPYDVAIEIFQSGERRKSEDIKRILDIK